MPDSGFFNSRIRILFSYLIGRIRVRGFTKVGSGSWADLPGYTTLRLWDIIEAHATKFGQGGNIKSVIQNYLYIIQMTFVPTIEVSSGETKNVRTLYTLKQQICRLYQV